MSHITVNVEYELNEKEQQAMKELLPYWQRYKNKEGEYPFKDWTVKDVFSAVMQVGCRFDISKRIKQEQFRQGMISASEAINDEPFRLFFQEGGIS